MAYLAHRLGLLRFCAVVATVLGAVSPAAAQETAAGRDGLDPRLAESVRWYTGVAGSVDDQRARELLLEALEEPEPLTTMWLARCHSRGRMYFERDETRAREIAASVIEEVRSLAEEGVAEAEFLMGTAYDEGLGRPVDPGLAAEWFHRAADQDHVLGQHNLGNAFFDGRGIPQSDAAAVYWWRRAAEQGDAIPQLRLGEMYEQGRGVGVDLDEARRWYGESAARGNAAAAEALARLGSRSGHR